MEWEDVPARVDELALLTAEPGWAIKRAAALTWTDGPVGYYWAPMHDVAALYGPLATIDDMARCRDAVKRAGYACEKWPLLDADLKDNGDWVKVAYSPALSRGLEYLNFFPGQYPGGIPNHPSPLAAMLTTGLIGGGLGYGVGRLGEAILPEHWERGRLRKTLALLGAGAGASLAAPWMYGNLATGHSITSAWPHDTKEPPENALPGLEREGEVRLAPPLGEPPGKARGNTLGPIPVGGGARGATAPPAEPPGEGRPAPKFSCDRFWKAAAESFGDVPEPQAHSPLDVNLDAMGRTLWNFNASPALAGTTMSTLYAAQQLPDENSRPGVATVGQLGQLAMNAGKGYLTGALVGAALNKAIGMPWRDAANAGAALGAIQTVIPILFGG